MYFFELGLDEKYFSFIKNGTKRVEIRLYKEKFKSLKLGDVIFFFKEPYRDEMIKVKVKKILTYSDFDHLIKNFNINLLADASVTPEKLLKDLNHFYPKDIQKQFEALAIYFDLIKEKEQ